MASAPSADDDGFAAIGTVVDDEAANAGADEEEEAPGGRGAGSGGSGGRRAPAFTRRAIRTDRLTPSGGAPPPPKGAPTALPPATAPAFATAPTSAAAPALAAAAAFAAAPSNCRQMAAQGIVARFGKQSLTWSSDGRVDGMHKCAAWPNTLDTRSLTAVCAALKPSWSNARAHARASKTSRTARQTQGTSSGRFISPSAVRKEASVLARALQADLVSEERVCVQRL